jgi:prepilin-type N-terminal cleavage/methylation domain-containing protein
MHRLYKTMKKLLRSQHFSRLPRRHTLLGYQINGFTLIELLIAAVLAPIIIVTVSNIFTSQVNSERRLIGAQSSENLRSRLSFLLESDIADGERVLRPTDAAFEGCNPSGSLFTIVSPHFDSFINDVIRACISYSITNGLLERTGPTINQNGSLDYSSVATQPVANGAAITNVVISDSQTSVSFNLELPSFVGNPARAFSVSYGTKNFRVGT